MLYGFLRIVFWGIAGMILFVVLKKKFASKRLALVSSITLFFVAGTVSSLLPIENLFIDFKSPESVFHYYQSGKVDDVIYGNNSSMVIYSKNGSSGGHFIIPKSTRGYKVPSLFSVKKVSKKFDTDGNFDVYHVLGTDDYYIFGTTFLKGNEITIVDSNGRPVKYYAFESGDDFTKTVLLFSYVENFTNDYYFLINGEKVFISDESI